MTTRGWLMVGTCLAVGVGGLGLLTSRARASYVRGLDAALPPLPVESGPSGGTQDLEVVSIHDVHGFGWQSVLGRLGVSDSGFGDAMSVVVLEEPARWKSYRDRERVYFSGHRVALVNPTSEDVLARTIVRNLKVRQQALDNDEWRYLQRLGRPFCGNAYGFQTLPAESALVFTVPMLDGEHEGLLRVAVDVNTSLSVVSEPFPGRWSDAYPGPSDDPIERLVEEAVLQGTSAE